MVTEIIFTLEVQEVEASSDISHQLDQFDWSAVIDVLLHSRFDQLHRVCVVLVCEKDTYPIASRLVKEDRFEVLRDRGILFIERGDSDSRSLEI